MTRLPPAINQLSLIDLRDFGESLLAPIELPGTRTHPPSRQGFSPGDNQILPKLRDMREDVCFRAEYLYLHNLVNLTGHNIRKACELSGLSRSRLYTLLKKYQITSH